MQPTQLDPKRSSQVCGQCHGVWEFYDAAGERQANSGGLPYRPGDDLSATRFVAQPTVNAESPTMKTLLADDSLFIRDAFWSDGKVRVSGREYNGLIESPCFKDAKTSERTMSCFSCHTLHKAADDLRPMNAWADDQLRDRGGAPSARPSGGLFRQKGRLHKELVELRDRAAVPRGFCLARGQQGEHRVEHRVVGTVGRRPVQAVHKIEVARSQRLGGLVEPIAIQRLNFVGVGHAAMPSRRICATSVLADKGFRSKSSSESSKGDSTQPSSKPISQAIS